MRNFSWCVYTYRHRKAFLYVAAKYVHDPVMREEIMRRGEDHDLDKMLMYLFMDQYESQIAHVQTQPHHLECAGEHSFYDLLETVIDYECAPYTKPDKPLNAYDFTLQLYEGGYISRECKDQLTEIMRMLGIDSSYTVSEKDPEGRAYMENIGEVSEDMILKEVMRYIHRHPEMSFPVLETEENEHTGEIL